MIDDVLEPSTPIPPTRPRRVKIAVAAVAAVAVLVGGLAVATSGGNEPEPLALVAGNAQGDARAEGAGIPTAAPMAAADSKMALDAPAYWGGIEYKVKGDLPDLGDKGTAWRVLTPDLDRATVSRWARALGLSGTPELRDGSWVVESSEANFNAYPGEGWSISYNRMRAETSTGTVSAADAERQARALLEGFGVLEGEWRVQVFETEIGVGYACAEAVKLREEEIARLDPDAPVSSEPASMPMPDCPPPPPAVKAQNVSFFPVVGGMRTEWGVWSVTVGPEGIENLYGNWVTFDEGDEYKLRSVDAALEELRQHGLAAATSMPMPMPVEEDVVPPPTDPALDPVAVSSGGGTSGSAGSAGVASGSASAGVATPTSVGATEPAMPVPMPEPVSAIDGGPAPDIATYPAYPYPCPPEADCQAPEPQVVTITDVELVLQPHGVYSGRASAPRMYLVPAYRFTGTFESGDMWESTVIALHPDAIAPPPAAEDVTPVEGREVTTLPMPAPADMGTSVEPAKPPTG